LRWLADECVAAPLVALLRAAGHDVLYVAEAAAGLSEADVITLALHDERLLFTEDKDFGDLVFRRKQTVPGVVLMRIDFEDVGAEDGALGRCNRTIRRRPFWPLHSGRRRPSSVSAAVRRGLRARRYDIAGS